MKRKYLGILAVVVVIIVGFVVIKNHINNPYGDGNKKVVKSEEVPIKIDQIDYKVEVLKKDGKIYEYLKAVNNSDVTINKMWVSITDGINPDAVIEYLGPIKSHGRTDNFDLKTSKDDRVKIPITKEDKKPVTEVGNIEVMELTYVVNVKGKPTKFTYDFNRDVYTVANF